MGVNKKTATTVVSVSMALIATQAMVVAARESKTMFSYVNANPDGELRKRLDGMLATGAPKLEINRAMALLAMKFGENEKSIAQKYFPDGQVRLAAAGLKSSDDFSTMEGGVSPIDFSGCYNNCYSNCHTACHGSRGWR